MSKTPNLLSNQSAQLSFRLKKKRGPCSAFFRNLNVMWAGNSLKNDLTELQDLQDFLLNSDSLKKSYTEYEPDFDSHFRDGKGMTSSILRTFKWTILKIILLVFAFKIFDVVLVYIMYSLSLYLK